MDAVVDTGQLGCYDNYGELVTCPSEGEPFYGQDNQNNGNQPSYTDNGDGTVTDNVTGLMWQQSPDTDGDGDIDAEDKLTYDEAIARAEALNLGGHSDWRLPTIKELYSLIDFNGSDPSIYDGTDTSGLVPFIDTGYFDFAYGDADAGERIIDAQYASSSLYVANTVNDGGRTFFGVNFADGGIKGYGLSLSGADKTFFVICVRGNTGYGRNGYTDNGDGTITDYTTDLMWSQEDSGEGLNWENALAWVAQKNAENYLGYSDCPMPKNCRASWITPAHRTPPAPPPSTRCSVRPSSPMKRAKRISRITGAARLTPIGPTPPARTAYTWPLAGPWGIWTAPGWTFTVRAPSAATPRLAIRSTTPPATAPRGMPSAYTTTCAWCATHMAGHHLTRRQAAMMLGWNRYWRSDPVSAIVEPTGSPTKETTHPTVSMIPKRLPMKWNPLPVSASSPSIPGET